MKQIPASVFEQHLANLGKTGSGKTNTAKVIVARHANDGRRVCILDPIKSDWWGITSNRAGDGPGLPFVILGGPRKHLPLSADSGAAVAELVGTGKLPRVIVDMSEFTDMERARWYVDFASTLIRVQKGVLVLVLEEADLFAPKEKYGGDKENQRLQYSSRLARMGRSKGIRLMLNCTRTQKLHNDLLSSCETIVAHRTSFSADADVLMDWLGADVEKPKANEIQRSLGTLATGEAWVCYREKGFVERMKFPQADTFDNTATPTSDGDVAEVTTAAVDLSAVEAAMASSIQAAKDNDPEELRQRIKELEKSVKGAASDAEIMDSERLAKLNAVMLRQLAKARSIDNRLVATERTLERVGEYLASMRESMLHATGAIVGHREAFRENYPYSPREAQQSGVAQAAGQAPKEPEALPTVPAATPARDRPVRGTLSKDAESLAKGPGLILDAIAWWESMGTKRPSRAQVAAVAGYAVGGGSFARYVSELKSKGLVTWSDPGTIEITPAGVGMAALADTPGSIEELQQRVLGILDAGPMKLLRTLLTHGGKEMGRTQLGELAGYEASGGSFARYMSTLRSLGLIEYPKKTTARPVEWLLRFSSQVAGGGK
jgi:uncharacterized protein